MFANLLKRLKPVVPPVLTDLAGAMGCCLVVYGAREIYEPLGYLISGLMLICFAIAVGRSS